MGEAQITQSGSYCLGVWDTLWDVGEEHLGIVLYKTYDGMFRIGTKGGEREGLRWFEEGQIWENRRIRE